MKDFNTNYVIFGRKYAPLIASMVGDTEFYHGERCTYESFVGIAQDLTKNLFKAMLTIIFDISMVSDKENLTGYFVWLRANFAKSRIIVLAPNLDSPELVSNAISCGIFDIIAPTIPVDADNLEEREIILSALQSAFLNPKQFADVYNQVIWQVPVLRSSQKIVKKGLFGKKKVIEKTYDDSDDDLLLDNPRENNQYNNPSNNYDNWNQHPDFQTPQNYPNNGYQQSPYPNQQGQYQGYNQQPQYYQDPRYSNQQPPQQGQYPNPNDMNQNYNPNGYGQQGGYPNQNPYWNNNNRR